MDKLLRQKLSDISHEIEKQLLLLSDLEKQRSAIRTQLNAVLDPVTRLPLELSSHILARCLPSVPEAFSASHAPILPLSVCHSWRNIALSTPCLWASIVDNGQIPEAEFPALFDGWLTLSRGARVSISISRELVDLDDMGDAKFVSSLKQHAHRVYSLKLSIVRGMEIRRITVPFTSLRKLTLEYPYDHDHRSRFAFTPDECIDVLRSAPRLEQCNLYGVTYYDSAQPQRFADIAAPLNHPSLTCLRLCSHGTLASSAAILHSLTLPALDSLAIHHFDISPQDFASFLQRSAPPLRYLYLNTYGGLEEPHSYFHLLPGLVQLTIRDHVRSVAHSLRQWRTGVGLLRSLERLTVEGNIEHTGDYAEIAHLLDSLSVKLKVFELPNVENDTLSGDVARFLEKLARSTGTCIQVGRRKFE
ncbi:hypothetical protein FB45DRAFT_57580 [Roridomyces roridus]|uniref:F-box domain-containing protein n=1 Tax=Roridomyces roridus TaxID=1738132 RepID=A0AAD7FMB5_9AGAR|nr:hypothetical protein FB45DRAFT_57580 [Roridomyces roridus]